MYVGQSALSIFRPASRMACKYFTTVVDRSVFLTDKVPPVVPGDGSLSRRAAEFLPAAVPLVHGHHDARNTRGVLEIRYFQDTQAVLRERHVLLLPDVLGRW